MVIEDIYKFPSKKRFWNGIYSLLMPAMPEGALTPLTACDAYRYFAGPGIVNDVTKVDHTEYLLPTDCITVLDS